MIYINGKEVKPYVGDYKPLTVYKGTEKLAGWVENTTEISSNIRIENGYSTMKVKPFGKSEQVQTEQSSNLCPNVDSDKWVLSGGAYKEDGYIVLPQVGAKAEMVVEWNGQTADADGQYVIRTGAVFDTEDTVNAKYHINLEYLNANKEVLSGNGNADIIGGNDIWRKYGVVYSADDEHGMAIRDAKYVTFTIQYSAQFNSSIFKFKNPLVSKTSNESYVAFVPDSPSPDYPSEIENVSGDLEVKVVGKNLFNINDENIGKVNCSEVLIEENSITITSLSVATTSRVDFPINYPVNKPLEISFDATIISQDLLSENVVRIYFRKDIQTYGAIELTKNNLKNHYSSKINAIPEKDIKLWLYVKSVAKQGTIKVKFENIQIEVGETATEYEPYKEQKVTFPFSEGQKLMKDGYLASDGIHNKRKQIVLTGNETYISEVLGSVYLYEIEKNDMLFSNGGKGLCSHFTNYINNYTTKSGNIRFGWNNKNIYFYTSFPALEEFKNWLTEQYSAGTPVIVEYVLAEEEKIEYTTEQQTAYNNLQKLKTYRTVTNISNNQDTNMKIMYKINN